MYDDKSLEAIVIDPGDDGQYITVSCLDRQITPKTVIATHGHFDHVLAALEVKLVYKIPFMMNKLDEFLLDRQQPTAEYFLGITVDPPTSVDLSLEEASIITIERQEKVIFVGDLIFADRRTGEANHKYSNPVKLHASIRRIKSEFKGYTAYPGHGEIFNIR